MVLEAQCWPAGITIFPHHSKFMSVYMLTTSGISRVYKYQTRTIYKHYELYNGPPALPATTFITIPCSNDVVKSVDESPYECVMRNYESAIIIGTLLSFQ